MGDFDKEQPKPQGLTRRVFLQKAAVTSAAVVGLDHWIRQIGQINTPKETIESKRPEYQLGEPRNLIYDIQLENDKNGGMAVWATGNPWGGPDSQVFVRSIDPSTGQPRGQEIDLFGKADHPKITSPRKAYYLLTATDGTYPPKLPWIRGFSQTALRLVNQNGEKLKSAIIYTPDTFIIDGHPSEMYEIASSFEKDGNFLFASIIPVEKLMQQFASLPPDQQKKAADLVKGLLGIDLSGPLPKSALVAAQININQIELASLPSLPEFGWTPVDGDITGLTVTPLPGNRYAFMYYKDYRQLEIRQFQRGKFSQAQQLAATGSLRDTLYDQNSGKILAVLRGRDWTIAAVNPQTLTVERQLEVPKPTQEFGETERRIYRIKLIPAKFGINALANIVSEHKGEVRSHLASAVISGSADRITPLTIREDDYIFQSAQATPNGEILTTRITKDQTGDKDVPKAKSLSASAFSQISLPQVSKTANLP